MHKYKQTEGVMENETGSKNFIEQIIEKILRKDTARQSGRDSRRNLMATFISDMPSQYFLIMDLLLNMAEHSI